MDTKKIASPVAAFVLGVAALAAGQKLTTSAPVTSVSSIQFLRSGPHGVHYAINFSSRRGGAEKLHQVVCEEDGSAKVDAVATSAGDVLTACKLVATDGKQIAASVQAASSDLP